MRKYIIACFCIIAIQMLFSGFLEHYVKHQHSDDLIYHSRAISSPYWEYNISGVERYLDLMLKQNDCTMIRILDSQEEILAVQGSPESRVEQYLLQIGLIGESPLVYPIFYEGKEIGQIESVYLDKSIYLDSLFLLILILISIIAILYTNLLNDRKELEIRVKERTCKLEEEVGQRQNAENELRVVLNSIGDGVIASDRDGRILFMNPVAEGLTGLHFYESYALHINNLLPMTDANTMEQNCLTLKTLLSEPIKEERKVLLEKAGKEKILAISSMPMFDQDGARQGMVFDLKDKTETTNLLDELLHSQRVDALGKLTGGIAHDFNNMINAINGAAQLLQGNLQNDGKAGEFLSIIFNASKRAAELTGQLLSLYRKEKWTMQPADIDGIIMETESLLQKAADQDVKIEIRIHDSELKVLCDRSSLVNSILNLGINAIHAMKDGGLLSISAKRTARLPSFCPLEKTKKHRGDFAEICVKDTGEGISESLKQKIFSPYFTTKEKGKGTGLGLSVVQRTIEQHNGFICLESEEHIGSRFYIYIPLFE